MFIGYEINDLSWEGRGTAVEKYWLEIQENKDTITINNSKLPQFYGTEEGIQLLIQILSSRNETFFPCKVHRGFSFYAQVGRSILRNVRVAYNTLYFETQSIPKELEKYAKRKNYQSTWYIEFEY